MNQKIITLLLAGLSLLPLTTPISAKVPNNGIITPCWNYMEAVDIEFNFLNSTANLLVERRSQVTTKIEGTLTVYKKLAINGFMLQATAVHQHVHFPLMLNLMP